MNFTITCPECSKYFLSTNFCHFSVGEELSKFVKEHYFHATNFQINIYDDNNNCLITQLFVFSSEWYDTEVFVKISDWIAERIEEINKSKSSSEKPSLSSASLDAVKFLQTHLMNREVVGDRTPHEVWYMYCLDDLTAKIISHLAKIEGYCNL